MSGDQPKLPGDPHESGLKLHVGCGSTILPGWLNIDLEEHDGVDRVLDARQRLPFADDSVDFVFAEHFLEHLTVEEGQGFLGDCFRVLAPGRGIIRLSTPNLDWVWRTHYRYPADDETKRAGAFHLNQAFHAWGHKYLYNDVVLRDALNDAGFGRIRFFAYGESEVQELSGLEQHEVNRYEATPECPDVIIAQGYVP